MSLPGLFGDRSPERILIIKPSSLGDVTHGLPILHLVRKRFPKARISWLVVPYCAGLLQNHPDLDEVILFDRRRFAAAWRSPRALADLIRFHRALRSRRFDCVIDLQGLFRSGWLAWQTGAAVRVGFANARELAPLFYTHRVGIDTVEQHAIDRYLKIAEALGCPTEPLEYHFPTTEADQRHVAGLVEKLGRFAVLLPATNWLTKRWPVENFAALVRPLEERLGLKCVVAGGADAAALAPGIAGALNLAGKTSIPQLVALLQRASLVIANDSGPMHIASALGRPLVALFGPTNPVRTGPHKRLECVVRTEIECSPCYRRRCSHQSCLRQLSVERVLAAAERQVVNAECRMQSDE